MTAKFEQLLKDIKDTEAYEIEVVRDFISEQIFNLMELQKVTKAELARKLNTSAPYITKLLQGNGNFTIETLVRIARALGCKFRPLLVPAAYNWKVVSQYNDSANFESHEQRVTQANTYKPSRRSINVNLAENDPATDDTNNGRIG